MDKQIEEKIEDVRRKIRRAHFKDAFDNLGSLVDDLSNRELDRMFTLLAARFNADLKEYIYGIQADDFETNKIIDALNHLLDEVELTAKEIYEKQQTKVNDNTPEEKEEFVQIEKIAYIKLIHLKERKAGATPFYKRYIPRLNREVEVFDEVQIFRIIKYSKPLEEIDVRDRSSGVVDINILHPWQELEFTDYGSSQIEELVTQVIDMNSSNVFCSVMYFINGFQKGNTDYLIQMENKTKVGRLLIDFSSLLYFEEFITDIPKGFKRIKGFEDERPVSVEQLRPGIFHLEAINLNKGDVVGLRFNLNWDKIRF